MIWMDTASGNKVCLVDRPGVRSADLNACVAFGAPQDSAVESTARGVMEL